MQQLWRHPPSRTLALGNNSGSPTRRLIDNRSKPKVCQSCAAFEIYQDINLAAPFSVVPIVQQVGTHSLEVTVDDVLFV